MARTAAQRNKRAKANARRKSKSDSSGGAQINPNDTLFFPRLRTHAKWMFVALAIVFSISFVAFGVGSGSTGISDIAALMVLSHQTHMTNLITRAGWEARASDPTLHAPFVAAPGEDARIAAQMRDIASEVVDYLLFIDEAPLAGPIRGSSGFTERFSSAGVKDAQGRSLHQLDLTRRLMRYPCSYLIYSAAFDGLPSIAKNAIYARMWQVLSGRDASKKYATLSRADRQAVVEILRDTKKDLPAYFQGQV
jgi:hypothetical protein